MHRSIINEWQLFRYESEGKADMMGGFGYSGMMGSAGLFGLITWLALLSFLILGSMYFWQEINKPKKK